MIPITACRRLKPLLTSSLLLTAVVLANPGSASESDETKRGEVLRDAFAQQYGARFDTNKLTHYITNLFRAVDYDRSGIEQWELDLYDRSRKAQIATQVAGRYLRYDLDGDGAVSREEVETLLLAKSGQRLEGAARDVAEQMKQSVKRHADKLFDADPNADGRIEPHEFAVIAERQSGANNQRQNNHSNTAAVLLSLDPDGDGKVTQAEALTLIGSAFQGVTIVPPKRRSAANQVPAPSCKAPQRPEGAKVVLVGAYEGSGVSSVSVAGQDAETSTAKLMVEPGDEPLFLVLTSYKPMVWRLHGHTGRVGHVVVAGRLLQDGKIAAGVTGLSRDKVSFVPSHECLPYFYKFGDLSEARARGATTKLVGGKPDRTLGIYGLHELSLPSGEHVKPAKRRYGDGYTIVTVDENTDAAARSSAVKFLEGPSAPDALKGELLRFNPAGVVAMSANAVVSDAKAADYVVLPQEAGLVQLVNSGALELIANGQFRIVQKTRYPAGLAGAHRVKFLLDAGVPEPKGNPGHSCVFSEDKAEFIVGRCR